MDANIGQAIDTVADLLAPQLAADSGEYLTAGRIQVLRGRLSNGSRDALAERMPDREAPVTFDVMVDAFEPDPRD